MSALASLLQFTNACRRGRDWSGAMPLLPLPGRAPELPGASMGPRRRELRDLGRTVADGQHQDATAQRDARCHRVFFRSYAPQVSVDVVSRALTLRRKKFDGAARRRGGGAERVQSRAHRSTATWRACRPTAPRGAPPVRYRSPTARSTATRAPCSSNEPRDCGGLRPGAGWARSAWSPRPGSDTAPASVHRAAAGPRPATRGDRPGRRGRRPHAARRPGPRATGPRSAMPTSRSRST